MPASIILVYSAMASWISSLLSFLWPSKISSDLSISRRLVEPLPLQPSTKYFTLALRDPQQPKSVVYILSTVLLSERSASDAQDLIKTVNPGAVIVQVGCAAMDVIHIEHHHALTPKMLDIYPTSALHVIKESFLDGNNLTTKYMNMAQADMIKAIFGTTFTGHVMAAKQAAAESKSSFYYLEGPANPLESEVSEDLDRNSDGPLAAAKNVAASLGSSLYFQPASKTRTICFDSPGLKFIASHVMSSLEDSLRTASTSVGFGDLSTQRYNDDDDGEMEYECPAYAQSFYPFLADLYKVYKYLPGMGLAFEKTQKLLKDVEKGKDVDFSELAVTQCFRLAVEGLRVALNSSAKTPLTSDKTTAPIVQFDDLPYEDKCHVLLAQALKQQAQQSQAVVAILDAGSVAGIRKHWMTPVPDHVAALAKECLVSEADEDIDIEGEGVKSKTRILDKPMIVVGAGAAAAVGVASLSHWAPVSTAMKIVTFKIPTIVKLGMLQTKKGALAAMTKLVTPVTNFMVPSAKGFGAAQVASGSKFSVLKAVGSTGKIRAAAHSVIATAEKASLSAIRTAFYNAMRNRHRKGVGGRPWLSFGASVAACIGLLTYGDGIENVIEIIPEATSIAQLGQGVKSLCHASNTLKQAEDAQYWETMYNRLYGWPSQKK